MKSTPTWEYDQAELKKLLSKMGLVSLPHACFSKAKWQKPCHSCMPHCMPACTCCQHVRSCSCAEAGLAVTGLLVPEPDGTMFACQPELG